MKAPPLFQKWLLEFMENIKQKNRKIHWFLIPQIGVIKRKLAKKNGGLTFKKVLPDF